MLYQRYTKKLTILLLINQVDVMLFNLCIKKTKLFTINQLTKKPLCEVNYLKKNSTFLFLINIIKL